MGKLESTNDDNGKKCARRKGIERGRERGKRWIRRGDEGARRKRKMMRLTRFAKMLRKKPTPAHPRLYCNLRTQSTPSRSHIRTECVASSTTATSYLCLTSTTVLTARYASRCQIYTSRPAPRATRCATHPSDPTLGFRFPRHFLGCSHGPQQG